MWWKIISLDKTLVIKTQSNIKFGVNVYSNDIVKTIINKESFRTFWQPRRQHQNGYSSAQNYEMVNHLKLLWHIGLKRKKKNMVVEDLPKSYRRNWLHNGVPNQVYL